MIENKRFRINLEYECIDDAKGELFIDFNDRIDFNKLCDVLNKLYDENEELKKEDELFFGKVFDILLKYQDLFNREMADEVLEELGIELTKWFE